LHTADDIFETRSFGLKERNQFGLTVAFQEEGKVCIILSKTVQKLQNYSIKETHIVTS